MLFLNPLFTGYILVLTFILGTVFGSFLNCMAWRIAHKESVLRGRSHCAVCGQELQPLDLVPVLSYLVLKGRCRYCGKKISKRYMLTELLTGGIFVSLVLRYDVTFFTLKYLVLACILIGVALVDMEIGIIPDGFVIAGILWWGITIPVSGEGILAEVVSGGIGAFAIGGGMLILSLVFDKVTGKESLGGGDIKLLFMLGLYQGIFGGLLNLILSCVIGIVMAYVWKKKKLPFGPAIALASYIFMLAGDYVVGWYMSLF